MSNSPIKPQQVRAEKTRLKLVDATITSLAKYGYAGSQLGEISDLAGVSRRPRQYYFPTRTILMTEVWHEIRRRDDAAFDKQIKEGQPLDVTVELIVNSALEKYKTPQYLADLHLKLAVRSDKDLAAALLPLMEQREAEADENWVELFAELGKPREQLITVRYLHVSLLRGLAIEYLARDKKDHLEMLESEFKRIMHSALA